MKDPFSNLNFQPMNPSIKNKWIAALRSGKFKQGHEQLMIPKGCKGWAAEPVNKNDRFCCLGVLHCVVNNTQRVVRGPERGFPSSRTQERANLDRGAMDVLASLNDQFRWSFKRIANWIQKRL